MYARKLSVLLGLGLLPLWLVAVERSGYPCASHGNAADQRRWEAFRKSYRAGKPTGRKLSASNPMPKLPSMDGSGELSSWGGSDPAKWRAEAIMANASSKALNDAWALPEVKDVVVAIPTQFADSGFHPYGDGQSNSKISFHDAWGQPRPQLVATLVHFKSGPSKVLIRFDRTIQRDPRAPAPKEAEIYFMKSGTGTRVKIPLSQEASTGDFLGEWKDIPSELDWSNSFNNQTAVIRPQPSFNDWFPLFFRHQVKTADELIQATPPQRRKFLGNLANLSLVDASGKYQDPLQIGAKAKAQGKTPFQVLMQTQFPQGYNAFPYTPQNIHAEYGQGGTVTGVGQGWTWVAEDQQARPFKIMYTCFERRNRVAEANARDGGVASGGGWHSINNKTPQGQDAPSQNGAEIIMNSLENGPLVVAAGFVNPHLRSSMSLPSGSMSYGLTDVATVRWLKPREGFVTTAGINQPNHHWYYFQSNQESCTEEWVGECGVEFACQ
jgi:hypothetical protein